MFTLRSHHQSWQLPQQLTGGHGMSLCGFSRIERPDYIQSLSSGDSTEKL